jgi:TetR/AcrR family transcriptional regulator, cholesterol catabolism regulator
MSTRTVSSPPPAKAPAKPSTAAQLDRHSRVLQSAANLVDERGADNVDITDISEHAHVALATLYRYFPSRNHLFASVAVDRMKRARARLSQSSLSSDTIGECVRTVAIEQFGRYQQHPELSKAILSGTNSLDPLVRPLSKELENLHLDLLIAAARVGNPTPSVDQLRLIPVVYYTLLAAGQRWLGGQLTADEAMAQISVAALALDHMDSVGI